MNVRSALGPRIQSVAMSVGLLAFGVALGIRWAAVDTVNMMLSAETIDVTTSTLSHLTKSYNQNMRRMLFVALFTLVAGVGLEFWGDE